MRGQIRSVGMRRRGKKRHSGWFIPWAELYFFYSDFVIQSAVTILSTETFALILVSAIEEEVSFRPRVRDLLLPSLFVNSADSDKTSRSSGWWRKFLSEDFFTFP